MKLHNVEVSLSAVKADLKGDIAVPAQLVFDADADSPIDITGRMKIQLVSVLQ